MDTKKAHRAVQKIAKREGVSEEEIIADIDRAIAQAVLRVREQNDMAAIAQWERIPCAGAVPWHKSWLYIWASR